MSGKWLMLALCQFHPEILHMDPALLRHVIISNSILLIRSTKPITHSASIGGIMHAWKELMTNASCKQWWQTTPSILTWISKTLIVQFMGRCVRHSIFQQSKKIVIFAHRSFKGKRTSQGKKQNLNNLGSRFCNLLDHYFGKGKLRRIMPNDQMLFNGSILGWYHFGHSNHNHPGGGPGGGWGYLK